MNKMKKFLFIAVFVLLLIDFTQSQTLQTYSLYLGDTINATDINKQKQGRWIYFGKDHKEQKYSEYKENQVIEEGFLETVKI